MAYDLTYYDEDNGVAYGIRVKSLTIGDAERLNVARFELADRLNREEVSEASYLVMQNLPMLQYGTAIAKKGNVEQQPDDFEAAELASFELTEDLYKSLPEQLVVLWLGAVLMKNPQHAAELANLKVFLSNIAALLRKNDSLNYGLNSELFRNAYGGGLSSESTKSKGRKKAAPEKT